MSSLGAERMCSDYAGWLTGCGVWRKEPVQLVALLLEAGVDVRGEEGEAAMFTLLVGCCHEVVWIS